MLPTEKFFSKAFKALSDSESKLLTSVRNNGEKMNFLGKPKEHSSKCTTVAVKSKQSPEPLRILASQCKFCPEFWAMM
jgi:hypothetical protein